MKYFHKLKKYWPIGVFLIVLLILWNTNLLFQKLKTEERNKMNLWALALQESIQRDDPTNLALEVLLKTNENPMIQVDGNGKIIDHKNLAVEAGIRDSTALYGVLEKIKKENLPIRIRYEALEDDQPIVDQLLYYGDSKTLKKLQYYPLALLLIIFLFGAVLYFVFKTGQVSEQNRLWAAMAKETAHQIGTPLSSLIGWVALSKAKNGSNDTLVEIEKDIERLQLITERFSKIGASPQLLSEDLVAVIEQTVRYLKNRTSELVVFQLALPKDPVPIPINAQLLSWTLENIIKNGIDAMKGKGQISVSLDVHENEVTLCIGDTGKGIKKEFRKRIFAPGFTTKTTGWGLGLSLAKRIIVDYHHGKIGVKKSDENGTVFEIVLNKT